MVQGELFREEGTVSNLSGSGFDRKKSLLSRFQLTISFDKFLIGLIGLTVVFVLTYSFGVEHGKRVMEKQIQTMFPAQTNPISTATQSAAEDHSAQPVQKKTVLLVGEPVSSEEQAAQEVVSEPAKAPPLAPERTVPSLPMAVLSKGRYTVQLVTYNNEQLAEREVRRLVSKGHEGFVIPSGSHFQVCVNYFETRTKAVYFLNRFPDSARYPDAYIRPVVR